MNQIDQTKNAMNFYTIQQFTEDSQAIRTELGAQSKEGPAVSNAFTNRHLGESPEWIQAFGTAATMAIVDLSQNHAIYHPGEPVLASSRSPVLVALYNFYIKDVTLPMGAEDVGRQRTARILLDRVRVGEPTSLDCGIYDGFLNCAKSQLLDRRTTARLIVGQYGAGKSHMLNQIVEMAKAEPKTLLSILTFTTDTRVHDPQIGYSMIVDGMRRNNQFFWDVFAETNRPEKLPMLGHIWDTLQDFPGNDTHNLTQEWLSGRACGTIKILVRQATGQTYTGLRTGEEAVAVYRAAFAHLKEQGFQCVVLIDEIENLAYNGHRYQDEESEWLRELVADSAHIHVFLGTTRTYVDQVLAKYPALYDRLWVDESKASPESATWHLDAKVEERSDKLWQYLVALHREAYPGGTTEAAIKVVETDILAEVRAERAPPRGFLRDACNLLDQGRHNMDALQKRIIEIKTAAAPEVEEAVAEVKEESSTASQDEVNCQAVNWTGAATLEGTRNKQIITACTALRNKGWDIVARDKEPKLSTGWERVKVGLRGTPGIVNRAKKSLELWVPHVTDKITWLNKFQSLLTWRIRNAEKRLTAFRKSLYRIMIEEGLWLDCSATADQTVLAQLTAVSWHARRIRKNGIALIVQESTGFVLQWVADTR